MLKIVPALIFVLAASQLSGLAQDMPALPLSKPNPYRDIAPGEPDREHLLDKGEALYGEGNLLGAASLFEQYVNRHTADPYGYYWLGKLKAAGGEAKQAAQLYIQSEDLAKAAGMDASELRVNLANTLIKLGYLEEASYDYQRALSMSQKDGLSHVNYAKLLLLQGKYGPGLEELRQAQTLGLPDPTIALFKALALHKMGDSTDAQTEAQTFLQASPYSPGELKALAKSLCNPQ